MEASTGPRVAAFTFTLVLAGVADAQSVLVVDREGRPGAQFARIQDAIDAAAPNDVIRVRPSSGRYLGFLVAKPVRILGAPGVVVTTPGLPRPAMRVEDLGPGETVVLSEMREEVIDPYWNGLQIERCAGIVHCERLTNIALVHIRDNAQVSFDRCVLEEVTVDASVVSFVDTSSSGFTGKYVASAALDILDSDVTLQGGVWSGVGYCGLGPTHLAPAIVMDGDSRLIVTGSQTAIWATRSSTRCGAAAIRATSGALVLSPEVFVIPVASGTVSGAGTIFERHVPYLRTRIEGGDLFATLGSEPGASVALLASPWLPAVRLPSAVPMPELWTASPVVVVAGAVPPTGLRTDRVAMPAGLFPATTLPFQSAVLVGGQLELSNAAVTVLAH